jgi:hypothetical protein
MNEKAAALDAAVKSVVAASEQLDNALKVLTTYINQKAREKRPERIMPRDSAIGIRPAYNACHNALTACNGAKTALDAAINDEANAST